MKDSEYLLKLSEALEDAASVVPDEEIEGMSGMNVQISKTLTKIIVEQLRKIANNLKEKENGSETEVKD